MKIAYADPPYIGQSLKHYGSHRDYAGEVDHRDLLLTLDSQYDGWLLHASSPSLHEILHYAFEEQITGFRVMAWVKPFAAFKPNVPVAYAWEPILVKPCRLPTVNHRVVSRDWVSANITMQKGLSGVKPESVCHWGFEMLGAEPDDEFFDLFPGSYAVTRAWATWKKMVRLEESMASVEMATNFDAELDGNGTGLRIRRSCPRSDVV